jgi:putative ABC transport system substrate-binding protein
LYLDKIARGANPGELPIMQPTRFELTVNQKVAKELGITIPVSVLVRADRLIE